MFESETFSGSPVSTLPCHYKLHRSLHFHHRQQGTRIRHCKMPLLFPKLRITQVFGGESSDRRGR
jgi:hypothetical protein